VADAVLKELILAKRAKNQDLLQWALTGAKDRLAALSTEMERIYRTFPLLKGGETTRAVNKDFGRAARRGRKRRRMSAAGRAKLRASAKRRWAEAKKAGKKRLE